MDVDPTKLGVGQYDSFHALTLTSQLVNNPKKGPVYSAPPREENQIYPLRKLLPKIMWYINTKMLDKLEKNTSITN